MTNGLPSAEASGPGAAPMQPDGGPYAEEFANAEYFEAEEFAARWVHFVETRPGVEGPILAADIEAEYQRLGEQVVLAYDYRSDDGTLRGRDKREVGRTLGLLRLLAEPPHRRPTIMRELAVSKGEKLVHLIWKEAKADNKAFDEAKAQAARVAELEEIARHDPLTGALNRRGEEMVVAGWCSPERRRADDPEPGVAKARGVLDVDLTKFKILNSLLGERTADKLLVEAVKIMANLGREEDAIDVVRVGGDEFLILVGNMSELVFNRLVADLRVAQEQKVDDDQQRRIWDTLSNFKTELPRLTEGVATTVFSVAERIVEDEPTTVLLLNGVPVIELSKLIVMSFGAAYGAVATPEDYQELVKEAHKARVAHKQDLHRTIGIEEPTNGIAPLPTPD